ncbi:MAG: YceI family protein [Bacteroidota bacterium]
MRSQVLLYILIASWMVLPGWASNGDINQDASVVSFEVKNLGVKTVEGTFKGMHGTVDFIPNDLKNSYFKVCINASTINTNNKKRDDHLREEDFFYVEEYPEICFESGNISATENGYEVQGKLTIRNITRIVSIPFSYQNNTLTGDFSIERKDYNVGNGFNNFTISNEVDVSIKCVLE